nr:MAG TPA: hypothetical protein [Caudoviricetes sp.]
MQIRRRCRYNYQRKLGGRSKVRRQQRRRNHLLRKCRKCDYRRGNRL